MNIMDIMDDMPSSVNALFVLSSYSGLTENVKGQTTIDILHKPMAFVNGTTRIINSIHSCASEMRDNWFYKQGNLQFVTK